MMKRPNPSSRPTGAVLSGAALAVVLAALGGCGERGTAERSATPGGQASWMSPPRIQAVDWGRGAPVVAGAAAPGARVVLRGDAAAVFAASADDSGRFEVAVAAPEGGVILTPEVQVGQDAAPGLESLLLAPGPDPVAALLVTGQASRRIGAGPGLDSIDGDGRGLLAAGRASPGTSVTLATERGDSVTVRAGADGRWTAVPPGLADAPGRLTVGGRTFAYPGPAAEPGLERTGDGWRATRDLPGGGRQTSWFPVGDLSRGDLSRNGTAFTGR